MNVGMAVHKIAESKGMRAADICNATGIADSYMSMLMRGQIKDPKLGRIYAIANALGVTVDEIVRVAEEYEDPH